MMSFIEEFWPVAFVFVIMGVSYARNAAKARKEAEQAPDEVLTEQFPTIDSAEEYENVPDEVGRSFLDIFTPKKSVQETPQRKRKRTAHSDNAPKKTATPPPAPVEEKQKEDRISMKNRSEAKKAFIYSEIFNRKY